MWIEIKYRKKRSFSKDKFNADIWLYLSNAFTEKMGIKITRLWKKKKEILTFSLFKVKNWTNFLRIKNFKYFYYSMMMNDDLGETI